MRHLYHDEEPHEYGVCRCCGGECNLGAIICDDCYADYMESLEDERYHDEGYGL